MIAYIIRFGIWLLTLVMRLRYRLTIKGLEDISSLKKQPGGILFLPNHPARVDVILLYMALIKRCLPRPTILEYYYYAPGVHSIAKLLRGVPVPDFENCSNSYKRSRIAVVLQKIIQGLKKGNNFVFYPSGHIKFSALEQIGGRSGLYNILNSIDTTPNIVLVRITGFWGSSFSRAISGENFNLVDALLLGTKIILKNLFFFTPRRDITVEFSPVGDDFPYNGDRREINKYLENWYNAPWPKEGEPCTLVPYSRWTSKVPRVISKELYPTEDVSDVEDDVKRKIIKEISRLSRRDEIDIDTNMRLGSDLGLDSLDVAELITFIEKNFGIKGMSPIDCPTVARAMNIAAQRYVINRTIAKIPTKGWRENKPRPGIHLPGGDTLVEVFFNNCDRMKKAIACADVSSGILTYSQLKLRVILLAKMLKKIPDKYVGVMLPASAAVNIIVLACQLADKVPVMMNWTLGHYNLKSMLDVSGVKTILTSWKFLNNLNNTELGEDVDKALVLLEELCDDISLRHKISAKRLCRNEASYIIEAFNKRPLSSDNTAVLLFTSGSEGIPKAVPLTHSNILNNYHGVLQVAPLRSRDILLSSLPSFHSFGFSVTGLLPLVCGFKVVYYPDPTDYQGIVSAIERCKATLMCSAPPLLSKMLDNAVPRQLHSLRLLISGGDKITQDFIDQVSQLMPSGVLVEGYGITECSPIVTLNTFNGIRHGVGYPLPGVELCVIDPQTKAPLPSGSQGIVLIRGPNVFKGYYGLDEDPFINLYGKRWYCSGDLGIIDSHGYLTITGRLKRFVKIGGEMISLPQIEYLLSHELKTEYNFSSRIAVCADEQSNTKKTTLVLFTTRNLELLLVNDILKNVGMSSLVKISKIKKINELPVTALGKVNYPLLEKMLEDV